MFEDDSEEVTPNDLASVSAITKEIDALKAELAGVEAHAESIRDKIKHLVGGALPDALLKARLPSVTTDSGRVITRKQIVSGTWPKEEAEVRAAVKWLAETNQLELIKTSIQVDFDRGDHDSAKKIFNALVTLPGGNTIKQRTIKETVHSQTLNAMLRKRMEEGKETPLELFKGFTTWIADIAEPGKRGKK